MRLLVVEDEPKIAKSLSRGLQAEGYVVDIAGDSDQAAVMTGSLEYDLILLDWMIPGPKDGAAFIRYLRSKDYPVPILMLTARSSIGDRVVGLDAGADDYLAKPFAFDELLARVRALLRRPKKHKGGELKADNLILDTIRKQAFLNTKPLDLTTKEFQLLEYLLNRKGEIVSKDDLLDHIWADEDRVQYNTIETFIANVRKKLGENHSLIRTRRGYGYIIE